MSMFRKKTEVPEEQALLSAMDDMRSGRKVEPGIEDVRDPRDEHAGAEDDVADDDGDTTSDRRAAPEPASGGPVLDFGSLKVPAVEGMQLRVEMDEQENPVAVSVMLDDTVLQLQAYGAARTEPLWDEVRQEIAEGIRGGQGKAREADGPFGRELSAEVLITDGEGNTTRQPARFIGRDGERWFLRGVITGAGVAETAKAQQVEAIFAGVDVERGAQAVMPREQLPIVIPDDPALVAGEQPPA